jgi:plastocyanin
VSTRRGRQETQSVTVADIGGSASATFALAGVFKYFDVKHPGDGDPDYKLQIVNAGGTVVWEATDLNGSNIMRGDVVAHVGPEIPTEGHTVRVGESTLAGLFNLRGCIAE